MPYIVTGDSTAQGRKVDFSRTNHDYDYPNGLDLKPGSDLHTKLVSEIITRANDSRKEISKRFSSWNQMDQLMTTYIPTDEKEELVKQKDSRKPISIVFPYTYSMLESLLTYLTMAFFQDPIFQYVGVGPEDTKGAMLLELVIRLHCIKTKVALSLHTVLRDCLIYGIGVGIPGWEIKQGKRPIQTTTTTSSMVGNSSSRGVEWINDTIFEGNNLDNVDPYMFLPDPSVASHSIQRGEYVGWLVKDNYMNMLSKERNGEDNLFNVKYLKEVKERKSSLSIEQSDRNIKYGTGDSRQHISSINPVDNIYMYINLIPKDWKLGSSEYPEKWLFCLSSDTVITMAKPIDYSHGMYPVAIASPEFDGYSATPISRIEMLGGLQGVLDWMFNSHITNVRKAINDMFIVDPFLVNINDLKDPKPGKLIRLRRPAWGKGVDKVVQQFQVNDVTRQNIADSAYITQWMDRISGADQSMSGALRQGGPERLTSSEFQGTRGSAVSRLQRVAMVIGLQFMQDIGTMFACHTQEYMSNETYVRIAGRNIEQLTSIFGQQSQVLVSPYDLAINYDVIVKDGSIPGGNFSNFWLEIFKTIGTTPELLQQFDITRIFTYIATQLGAKNIEEFKRNVGQVQPTVMPDEQVMSQVQQGNLVPLEGGI